MSVCECGFENAAGTAFCATCGRYLAWETNGSSPTIAPTAGAGPANVTAPRPVTPSAPTQPNPLVGPSATAPAPHLPPPGPASHPGGPAAAAPAAAARRRQALQAELTPDEAALVPGGGPVSFTLKVTNTGEIVENVNISVLGLAPQWYRVDRPSFRLDKEGDSRRAEVSIEIRLERAPRPSAGRMPLRVVATSASDPTVNVARDATIDVAAFGESAMAISPQAATFGHTSAHVLSVVNRGNTTLTATPNAADAEQALAYRFEPPVLQIEPGGEARTRMHAMSGGRAWTGPSRRFAVTVGAHTDGGPPPQPMGINLTQPPRLPAWVLRGAMALLTLTLVVAGFFGVRALTKKDQNQPIAVPDVMGQSFEDASDQLRGLKLRVVREDVVNTTNDEDLSGKVVAIDPAVDTKVKPDSPVTLSVAQAPDQLTVPDVRGLRPDEAKPQLESVYGLVLEVGPAPRIDPTGTYPAGAILDQQPAPGSAYSKGKPPKLSVTVSDGRPKKAVPGVQGRPAAEARNLLIAAGFAFTEVYAKTQEVTLIGTVEKYEPAGPLEEGSEVQLTILQSDQMLRVPNVLNPPLDGAVAIATLAQANFQPERLDVADENIAAGLVVETDPPVGQLLNLGSKIVVKVSGGKGVVVPDQVGETVPDAIKALNQAGLTKVQTLNCRDADSTSTVDDMVLADGTPATGARVLKDQPITLDCNEFTMPTDRRSNTGIFAPTTR